ncbi:MAG: FtsX-like permease family protein [Luteitalea sp.]|nr:FtsX-like permease family protein [Luteitalea sp.]
MSDRATPVDKSRTTGLTRLVPDLRLGLENLRLHKLRSLLTMLGMICGVAAVVSMLSIGAGAQQHVLEFIENLGVRNLIVEAREAADQEEFIQVRQISPGLTFRDVRLIDANLAGVTAISPRKRFTPSTVLPRPGRETPTVYGVLPVYRRISNLRMASGRFFDEDEATRASPVCVLGEAVASDLFGSRSALGQFVKIHEQWFRVIGVAGPQLSAPGEVAGLPSEDRNNLIYVPLAGAMLRLEDNKTRIRDEIDAIYVQLQSPEQSPRAAGIVRGLLNDSHKGAGDFSVYVPAQLLAEQQRTRRIFEMVMVAIASISLLVGGIGIMNIMLASVLERTREIGVRRAVGARRSEIVRQFLMEATIISCAGGLIGVLVGFGLSELVAYFAGWTTIITPTSVLLAFFVSLVVGLVFGVYPARTAAHLDPVEALRYE